mmetsp:Transcript_8921/g.10328  ORF Transcript_8921/g.10328 Transcript_8921/m.10328 type:complete len:328 (-) Transcript_8921:443-1426(-)
MKPNKATSSLAAAASRIKIQSSSKNTLTRDDDGAKNPPNTANKKLSSLSSRTSINSSSGIGGKYSTTGINTTTKCNSKTSHDNNDRVKKENDNVDNFKNRNNRRCKENSRESSHSGAGRGGISGSPNRQEGRGNQGGQRGKVRGKHKFERNDNENVTKRIEGDIIHFEYIIDSDDDDTGSDEEGTKQYDQNKKTKEHKISTSTPSSYHSHHHKSSNGKRNNNSGGRILNVRASNRLINHHLGRKITTHTQVHNNPTTKTNDNRHPTRVQSNRSDGLKYKDESNNKIQRHDMASGGETNVISREEFNSLKQQSPMKRWADEDDDDNDY